MRLNLGCGTNRLDGWHNYDAELDITRPLPFADNSVEFILCEHCLEHISYKKAISFLGECRRVLKPRGVVRIACPSLVRIWNIGTDDYFKFTSKWANGNASRRGAMRAIIYAHGHEMVYDDDLLAATIYVAGFDIVKKCFPGLSDYAELCGVEGHAAVIGEKFNDLETIVCEGIK